MGTQRDLDAYEARRLKGVELFEKGYGASEVAGRIGVSRQAVWQWLQDWRRGGKAALARVRHKGRPPRVSIAQRQRLAEMLREGATAHGYPNDLWSGRRVARLIQDTFAVTLHHKHVPKLLRSISRGAKATSSSPASRRRPSPRGNSRVGRRRSRQRNASAN